MPQRKRTYVFESSLSELQQVSPDVTISAVTTVQDFKVFFQIPWTIYEKNVYWVPPFWVELRDFFLNTNLFWTHAETRLFIARWNNRPVGRIAAFIDHQYYKTNDDNVGFFGFFECIDNFDIASFLLHAVEEWISSKGMALLYGPINGRIDVGSGFLCEGFQSPPSLLSSYSPSYYLDFMENYGMKKLRDQLMYHIDLIHPIPAAFKAIAKKCEAEGVTIRKFHRRHVKSELNWWIPLFLEIFSEHWGYVPVCEEEMRTRFGIKQLRWIIDPKLFLVAEVNNEPIAFLWTTPDYNQIFRTMNGELGLLEILKFFLEKSRINKGKFHFIGVKKKYRNLGIGTLLNYSAMVEMKKRGFTGAECGWIDEQNIASQTIIEKTGAKVCKRFRVYQKMITSRNDIGGRNP
jgi:hypothetical protein